MQIVNIHEAKTHLSRLVQRAAAGEDIVIGKAGVPIARLTAFRPTGAPRTPGAWKGQVRIHDDFDDLPADVAAGFGGQLE